MKQFANLLFFIPFFLWASLEEKPMVVIIPSYNNSHWYQKNLDSVLSQKYKNYRVIYIDDCSTDGTGKEVNYYLNWNDVEKKVKLIQNKKRKGALCNLYHAIHSCKDEEIIIMCDGDDWFYHKNVLAQINEVYSSGEVWYTHGTLIEYPTGLIAWCEPFSQEVIEKRNYRAFKCPSHLRTCYAWLFKKIALKDFLYEDKFLKMAWDMAIMYPLAEMAGKRHAFIKEPNYVYNMINPINDNKVDPDLQNLLDRWIRNKPPYSELK